MNVTKNCLIIFTKIPQSGFVKSRLVPKLNFVQAADLAQLLLEHTINIAKTLKNTDIHLYTCGDASLNLNIEDFATPSLYQQQGQDLGERLLNALQSTFQIYQRVVIIGSDCAAISPNYIESAFQKLTSDSKSIVIGPSVDGGYVLLGLNYLEPTLFQNIPWGTSKVLSNTRERLKTLKQDWIELMNLWDIDLPTDLQKFLDWYSKKEGQLKKFSYNRRLHEIYHFLKTQFVT